MSSAIIKTKNYVDTLPAVLQYRQAHYEIHGQVAPPPGLPIAHAWPPQATAASYKQKLIELLPRHQKGAEIGPLNLPLLLKPENDVLYVDHLDTEGLRAKYPSVSGIVDVHRVVKDGDLEATLATDAPLAYMLASQALEHHPNPLQWLQDVARLLDDGGLLAVSLPDRRMTFDFLREESTPADLVAAYLAGEKVPSPACVYDHHSLASFINMAWATSESVSPQDLVEGQGKVRAKLASIEHLALVERARGGEYFDVHAWVFTPPGFLLTMAQLAIDGFVPFLLKRFYPTAPAAQDRDNTSFIAILEKASGDVPPAILRQSFLRPLGP